MAEPFGNICSEECGRAGAPVPLSKLPDGRRARVAERLISCEDCELLNAMGLTHRCELRVCQAGEPCIVQVASTRLGLSSAVARQILVMPLDDAS